MNKSSQTPYMSIEVTHTDIQYPSFKEKFLVDKKQFLVLKKLRKASLQEWLSAIINMMSTQTHHDANRFKEFNYGFIDKLRDKPGKTRFNTLEPSTCCFLWRNKINISHLTIRKITSDQEHCAELLEHAKDQFFTHNQNISHKLP